jgi:hypothetical protein
MLPVRKQFFVPERSFMHIIVSCWFLKSSGWGEVRGSSVIVLLNCTSAVMLLNRSGGVVWALKPPVGSWTWNHLGTNDLYRPVHNAFDAGSIHYLGKWEGVGPCRLILSLWWCGKLEQPEVRGKPFSCLKTMKTNLLLSESWECGKRNLPRGGSLSAVWRLTFSCLEAGGAERAICSVEKACQLSED